MFRRREGYPLHRWLHLDLPGSVATPMGFLEVVFPTSAQPVFLLPMFLSLLPPFFNFLFFTSPLQDDRDGELNYNKTAFLSHLFGESSHDRPLLHFCFAYSDHVMFPVAEICGQDNARNHGINILPPEGILILKGESDLISSKAFLWAVNLRRDGRQFQRRRNSIVKPYRKTKSEVILFLREYPYVTISAFEFWLAFEVIIWVVAL